MGSKLGATRVNWFLGSQEWLRRENFTSLKVRKKKKAKFQVLRQKLTRTKVTRVGMVLKKEKLEVPARRRSETETEIAEVAETAKREALEIVCAETERSGLVCQENGITTGMETWVL